MRFLVLAALSFGLFAPENAYAQRGGRGGNYSGNRWYGGGSYGNNWYGNGWNGGRWYGNWNRGYFPYSTFGWGGYYTPGYTYYTPDYSGYIYSESSPRISSYYDPLPNTNSDSSVVSPNRARLDIRLTNPDAIVLIQGQKMSLTVL
ncbi:MAG: hypothetical protein QM703_18360 [Gemmatales bacterium]